MSFCSLGYSSPNPPVACIAVNHKNEILAQAFTQKSGEEHAERFLYNHNNISEKHELYVTLEPCTHFGKTPPCIDIILEKKPTAVLVGISDPNPLIDHRKNELYEKNKIQFRYIPEIREIANVYLNGFLKRMRVGQPSFIIKTVVSMEGFFTQTTRERLRLSNDHSLQITNLLRAKVDGVVVGPETIAVDIPSLEFHKLKTDLILEPIFIREKFINKLVNAAFKQDSINFHNERSSDFQPIRIFIIGDEEAVPESFLLKQKEINQTLISKRVWFFLLGNRNGNNYSLRFITMLKELTEFPLESVKENLADYILHRTGELGLNNLLVEGGNLLYTNFATKVTKADKIIKVITEQSIKEGIEPEIDHTNLCLTDTFLIKNNKWEIFELCSQD